jgi:predicted dehydrogenase
MEHTSAANLDPTAPLTWRQDYRISGVNTLSLGICYEPLLRWLDGDGKVSAATAATFVRERPDADGNATGVTVPDSVNVLGRWADRALLRLHVSSTEPGGGQLGYRLVGARSVLHYDVFAGKAWCETADGEKRELTSAALPNGGWAVEAQFVDSIRTGSPVRLTDFATGRRYMEFTEAAWQAWQG